MSNSTEKFLVDADFVFNKGTELWEKEGYASISNDVVIRKIPPRVLEKMLDGTFDKERQD